MTDDTPRDEPMAASDPAVGPADEASHPAIRDLLRASAGRETPQVDVLAGFQKKVRERSGGKFYDDGWSTEKEPPIMTYLITSLIMLAVVAITFFVLYPLSGTAAPAPVTPAPVQVIPPSR